MRAMTWRREALGSRSFSLTVHAVYAVSPNLGLTDVTLIVNGDEMRDLWGKYESHP